VQIVFSNNTAVDLILESTPLATVYQKIYKHLGHVSVPFRRWDHPFYCNTLEELVEQLILCASKVSVTVCRESCLNQDQNHFNAIHEIYEHNYNGDPAWLNFHEHIHLCERWPVQKPRLIIDYREKSGMLERPFDLAWLENATTKIKAGDVFVEWAELGKTPYGYWENNEPDNMDRMCELAKPWLTLRPKIVVALEDIDTMNNVDIPAFESWWKQHSKEWCRHWNLLSWSIVDIFSVVRLGQVPEFKNIIEQLKNNNTPTKILL
jgi:hypothetical protein